MVLVDHQIKALCCGVVPWYIRLFYRLTGKKIDKFIEPMVSPITPECINPHSLDIRIGHKAKLRTTHGYVDIKLTDDYKMFPGDRLLVESLETFKIPEFTAVTFYMKSSRGREWYGHQLASYIDAGWNRSRLTMEITNDDLEPLPLYPGMRFGQLEFRLLLGLPSKSYAVTGRYNNDKTVQESKG
jgi:deoxycytidine triphosphate deaminase